MHEQNPSDGQAWGSPPPQPEGYGHPPGGHGQNPGYGPPPAGYGQHPGAYGQPEGYGPPHDYDGHAQRGQGLAGIVRQVPVLSVLLIIQGSLECLVGLLLGAMGPMMFSVMQQQGTAPKPPPGMPNFVSIMTATYIILGLVILACGILKIVAGARSLRYRGRTLGIIACFSSLGMFLGGCYCLPTAIALMVYGLVVYFNGDVARAFEMADEGYTAEQIKGCVY